MQPKIKNNFELPVREKIISDRGSVHMRFYSLSFKNKWEGLGEGWLNSFLPLKKKGGLNYGFTVNYLPPTDIRASIVKLGSLSSDVFERRTSTGSERFSLLVCIDATKFLLLSVFTLIESICPNICSKSRLKGTKKQLPVDFRRSKTLSPKLPNNLWPFWAHFPAASSEHAPQGKRGPKMTGNWA